MREEEAETAEVTASGRLFQRETDAGRKDFSLRTEEQTGKAKE